MLKKFFQNSLRHLPLQCHQNAEEFFTRCAQVTLMTIFFSAPLICTEEFLLILFRFYLWMVLIWRRQDLNGHLFFKYSLVLFCKITFLLNDLAFFLLFSSENACSCVWLSEVYLYLELTHINCISSLENVIVCVFPNM